MRPVRTFALLVVFAVPITLPVSLSPQTESTFDGSITGRVVNRTSDGDEVGSVPLSLLVFRRMTQESEIFGQSDIQGHFRFERLEVHSDMRYFVQAGYKNVAYRSAAIDLTLEAAPFVEVAVWETTTRDTDVVIDRASVAFPTVDESIGLIGVLELVTFVNKGDRTYVGDLFLDPPNGGVIRVSLPENALEIKLGHGFGPDGFVTIPGGVINKAPLLPGTSELVYGYAIPYVGSTASLERRYLYHSRNVIVLIPNRVGEIHSAQLELVGPVPVDGQPATLFTTSDLPSGPSFELRLTELPVFVDLSSSGLQMDTILRYAAVVMLGVIATGALAFALAHRSNRKHATADFDVNTLMHERVDLVNSIATLDVNFGSGHVPNDEYQQQRHALRSRLVDIALMLEEESKAHPPPRDQETNH